jgi:hypothetical protein
MVLLGQIYNWLEATKEPLLEIPVQFAPESGAFGDNYAVRIDEGTHELVVEKRVIRPPLGRERQFSAEQMRKFRVSDWTANLPADAWRAALARQHQPAGGEPWGLFALVPGGAPSVRETARVWGEAKKHGGIELLPGYHAEACAAMAAYVQSFQDPATGDFSDPMWPEEPGSQATLTEMVDFLRSLGAKPAHPHAQFRLTPPQVDGTTLSAAFQVADWTDPLAAAEVLYPQFTHGFRYVMDTEGETLIAPLERALNRLIQHQNPTTGMWGNANSDLIERLLATRSLTQMLQWEMGLRLPRHRQVVDSLLSLHANGGLTQPDTPVIAYPAVAELAYAALMVEPYRRPELREMLIQMLDQLRVYQRADGGFSTTPSGVAPLVCHGVTVFPRSKSPRSNAWATDQALESVKMILYALDWSEERGVLPERGAWAYRPFRDNPYHLRYVDDSLAVEFVPYREYKEDQIRTFHAQSSERRWRMIAFWMHEPEMGEPWGLFPPKPWGEPNLSSTASAWKQAPSQGGLESLEGYHEEARADMISFVQRHQDPVTGRFTDPWSDADVTSAMVSFLDYLDAKPLRAVNPFFAWAPEQLSPINPKLAVDTETHLMMLRNGDWDVPWNMGSHGAIQSLHIYRWVNDGREELIPLLEDSVETMISYQNQETGMWGPSSIRLDQQIGGCLKVIGRYQWGMRLVAPHMDSFADSIIEKHRTRAFYGRDTHLVVLRNIAEMTCACLAASDYRKEELEHVLMELVDEAALYEQPDGYYSAYPRQALGMEASDGSGSLAYACSSWAINAMFDDSPAGDWREVTPDKKWLIRMAPDDVHAEVYRNPNWEE